MYKIRYENKNNEYSSDLWDGVNMNGKEVEIATYYYVITLNNEELPYTGTVNIIR